MITFKPIGSLQRGQLYKMLTNSYQDLIEKYDAKNKEKYLDSWQQLDKDTFNNSKVGKCILISYLNDKPVGFFSWDPRHFPEYGIVGQNCILSKYKGLGYGKIQIVELINIFKKAKCKKAFMSTGDNDFFIPAQKMYESLGFVETGRHLNEKWGFDEIKYEKPFL